MDIIIEYICATLEDMTGLRWEWYKSSIIDGQFVSVGAPRQFINYDGGSVWDDSNGEDDDGVSCSGRWVPLEFGDDWSVREVLERLLSYMSTE